MQPAQAAPINPAHYQQQQQQQQWYQQQQQSQYQQPQVAQQQYAPPPQQQQHYAPPQQQQQQQVYYQPPQAPPQQAASGDEIRTLWIGDLQYFMEEAYLANCFGQSGEVRFLFIFNLLFFIIVLCFDKFMIYDMRIGYMILV